MMMMMMMMMVDDLNDDAQALKKTELLDSIVEKTGVTKVTAGKIVDAFTESIAESLAAGKKGE